jgi:hypothetical protein
MGLMKEAMAPPAETGAVAPEAKDEREEFDEKRPREKMHLAALAGTGIDATQKQAENVFQERLLAAQSAQDSGGALPARFAIPKAGSSLRFDEYLTIGEASTLRLGYGSRHAVEFFNLLPLLLTALLAWFSRKLLSAGRRGAWVIAAGAILLILFTAAGLPLQAAVMGALLGAAARAVAWVGGKFTAKAA